VTEIAETQTATAPATRWWALDPEAATAELATNPAADRPVANGTARTR